MKLSKIDFKMMRTLLMGVFLIVGLTETSDASGDLSRTYFRAVSIEEAPYLMKKEGSGLIGNEQYEGFIVDILDELSAKIDTPYRLYLVEDGRYGVKAPDGRWTGMVGDVVEDRADIVAAALTITDTRRDALIFSDPFMEVPLTLLAERTNQIDSLQDAITHPSLKIGVLEGGRISDNLQSSIVSPYTDLWGRIASTEPKAFVGSIKEGVQRVTEGNFSLIMELPAAEYLSADHCDLTTNLQFSFEGEKDVYAFGISKTLPSNKVADINEALKQLMDSGFISELKEKWWRGKCSPSSASNMISIGYRIVLALVGFTYVLIST